MWLKLGLLFFFFWIRIEMHCRKKPALHEHARMQIGELRITVHNCFVSCDLQRELIGHEARIYKVYRLKAT